MSSSLIIVFQIAAFGRKLGSLKDGKINEVTTAIIEILQQAPSPPPPASKALERSKPLKNE